MNFRHLLGCGTIVKVRNFLDVMARKSHDVNGLVWKFWQALIVYRSGLSGGKFNLSHCWGKWTWFVISQLVRLRYCFSSCCYKSEFGDFRQANCVIASFRNSCSLSQLSDQTCKALSEKCSLRLTCDENLRKQRIFSELLQICNENME